MKKALVVGIIVLFLGVVFQPALANEISINNTSNINEDCGCQGVNRVDLLRVKLLLIRLEVFTNILLTNFGHIPELTEKCEEILDIIHSNRGLFNEFICAIVAALFVLVGVCIQLFSYLSDIYYEDYPLISNFFLLVTLMFFPPGAFLLYYFETYCL